MDKENGSGDVESKFKLLNFPEREGDDPPKYEYEINIVFTSGKTMQMTCEGFAPMVGYGEGMIGFWASTSNDIDTIVNFNKVDFFDIEKMEKTHEVSPTDEV